MNTLLTVSRAARLVGVARGVLQKKIKDGALDTFEGMVRMDDLQRLYPQAHFEDNSFLERLNLLKDGAYARRLRERILPDPEVLVVRLAELGRELSESRAELKRWRAMADAFHDTIQSLLPAVSGAARQALEDMQARLRALQPRSPEAARSYPLAALDSALTVISAHVRVLPTQHEFFVEGNDTLLEAALRAGLSMNYGCSNGNCGLCRARVQTGQVKKIRPHDYVLTEADKQAGTVLMCCHTAVTDLVIETGETDAPRDIPLQQIAARVKSVERQSGEVAVLHLQTPRTRRLRFLAGQYVALQAGDTPAVDYPIASCPCDDRNLQFHIPRTPANALAAKVFSELRAGDTVNVLGPRGEFVLNEESPHNLLFIASDTGFAPIKSLIEHAMALDVAESISLYWFTRRERGHYLDNQCRAWADALDNFHYQPVTLAAEGDALHSRIEDIARAHQPLRDCDVYVAGSPGLLELAETAFGELNHPRAQLVLGYPR
jgi:CDP-4-dehydro-6-deoxyglucose reductase, E3